MLSSKIRFNSNLAVDSLVTSGESRVVLDALQLGPDLLFLSITAWDGVVDGEDVLGIDDLLHLVLPFNGQVGKCSPNELLPDLTDSMMMRDATADIHDLISGGILHNLVLVHACLLIHALVGK